MGNVIGTEEIELVTNGTFDTDTDWTKFQQGWSISGGKARHSGDPGFILQDIAGANHQLPYLLKFEVDSFSGGPLVVTWDLDTIIEVTATGSYQTATNKGPDVSPCELAFHKFAGICILDNVSVFNVTTWAAITYGFMPQPEGKTEWYELDDGKMMLLMATKFDKSDIWTIIDPAEMV